MIIIILDGLARFQLKMLINFIILKQPLRTLTDTQLDDIIISARCLLFLPNNTHAATDVQLKCESELHRIERFS
ncbi:hypothetical protein T07_3824 [Trichinella nelsoni]|uniref:Uncharacterized protein n=1 Tax=Trichinella nelsoni TaxID=6336 RepID=A0A0V0S0J1_9BILA|nr:hypothetical protein T07_3824 [Trichinella nelsoni]